MLTVDRIEGDLLVCENDNGERFTLSPGQYIPPVSEGDVLVLINGIYCVDPEETERRREEIIALSNDLFE